MRKTNALFSEASQLCVVTSEQGDLSGFAGPSVPQLAPYRRLHALVDGALRAPLACSFFISQRSKRQDQEIKLPSKTT